MLSERDNPNAVRLIIQRDKFDKAICRLSGPPTKLDFDGSWAFPQWLAWTWSQAEQKAQVQEIVLYWDDTWQVVYENGEKTTRGQFV